MNENKEFKPYIPADKITPEFTVTSIIMGVILAVIFGAANAYLGLRVGMTVSASIPAAVISMGVIRKIMKKNSILESNMVQTIGSAGESLAAGAIFTMPALFLWAEEGLCEMPGIVEITLIALCGGVLGVLFMVPLRNALIVKEHATLLYPEGTACADVLLAGEEGGANAATVFSGMGIAAIFKFVVDGLKVIPADVAVAFKGFKGEIGMECYPALLGVGYIVGPRIASFMFVGSLIGWMVLIPVICLFGADTVMYPGTETISALYAAGGASKIWSTYVKYIGAGAIATGGIISLIKSLPLIIATFRDSMKSMKGGKNTSTERTAQDLPMNVILIGIVAGGVLPVETVAFQNLTLVAQEIFPTWLYLFFVFGGAVFALLTTLNGTLSWVTRGLQAAAKQGWLPEKTAEENKNGVPVILLMVFFLMGAIPILTGMDLTLISNMGVGTDMVTEFMVLLACWRLPDIFPEEYQKSAFCMKKRTLHILLFFIGILMIGTSYVNLSDLTVPAAIACGIYILVMFVYTQVRYPYVKAKQEKKENK